MMQNMPVSNTRQQSNDDHLSGSQQSNQDQTTSEDSLLAINVSENVEPKLDDKENQNSSSVSDQMCSDLSEQSSVNNDVAKNTDDEHEIFQADKTENTSKADSNNLFDVVEVKSITAIETGEAKKACSKEEEELLDSICNSSKVNNDVGNASTEDSPQEMNELSDGEWEILDEVSCHSSDLGSPSAGTKPMNSLNDKAAEEEKSPESSAKKRSLTEEEEEISPELSRGSQWKKLKLEESCDKELINDPKPDNGTADEKPKKEEEKHLEDENGEIKDIDIGSVEMEGNSPGFIIKSKDEDEKPEKQGDNAQEEEKDGEASLHMEDSYDVIDLQKLLDKTAIMKTVSIGLKDVTNNAPDVDNKNKMEVALLSEANDSDLIGDGDEENLLDEEFRELFKRESQKKVLENKEEEAPTKILTKETSSKKEEDQEEPREKGETITGSMALDDEPKVEVSFDGKDTDEKHLNLDLDGKFSDNENDEEDSALARAIQNVLDTSRETVEEEIIIEEVRSKDKVSDQMSTTQAMDSLVVAKTSELQHPQLTPTPSPRDQKETNPTDAPKEDDKDETEIIVITESEMLEEASTVVENTEVTTSTPMELGGNGAKSEQPDSSKAPKSILLTSRALEDMLKQTVQDYLLKGGKNEIKLLKQKCEILEKSLERWRRRALQLQKQVNDIVTEQQKQSSLKPSQRVSVRSVGINVEISPNILTQQKGTGPVLLSSKPPIFGANKPTTSGLQISTKDQQQAGRFPEILPKMTSSPPSLTVTAIPAKPKTPTPSSLLASALKVGRPEPKPPNDLSKGQLSRAPVPLQLIANSATSSNISVLYTATKTLPSATTVTTTSSANTTQNVKVIDLTKEDDDSTAKVSVSMTKLASPTAVSPVVGSKVVAPPSSSVSGVGIATTLSVPVMSTLPPTLQVIRQTTPTPIMTPAASGRIRVPNSISLQPIPSGQQVAYLLPRVPSSSSLAVFPRMSGPVSNLAITSPSNRAPLNKSPLPTIYFQRGNTVVPLHTQVAVPVSQVATLQTPGKTVSLGSPSGPPPLQINVSSASRVADSTVPSLGTQSLDVSLGSPKPATHPSILSRVGKHPAPFPPQPTYPPSAAMKAVPPKPTLKISKVSNGIVLSWNMFLNVSYAEIVSYQLYAYQESNCAPTPSLWKKIGDVRALPLPMACTLTQFVDGHKYHFAVRALDVHNRIGNFSDPASIILPSVIPK